MDRRHVAGDVQELLALQCVVRQRLVQLGEDLPGAEEIDDETRARLLDRLWLTRADVERTYNGLLWLAHLVSDQVNPLP